MYSNACDHSVSYNLLYQLWRFECEGVPSEFKYTYDCVLNQFISALTSDVSVAVSFFNTLNFNDEVDSYAMHFVNLIDENLQTQAEKKTFEKLFSTLSQKYPNSPYVDWRAYQFNDSSSSLDDESLSNDSDAESTDREDECD